MTAMVYRKNIGNKQTKSTVKTYCLSPGREAPNNYRLRSTIYNKRSVLPKQLVDSLLVPLSLFFTFTHDTYRCA